MNFIDSLIRNSIFKIVRSPRVRCCSVLSFYEHQNLNDKSKTFSLLAPGNSLQAMAFRSMSLTKYQRRKKEKKRKDMSWAVPIIERSQNPPQPQEPSKLHMVERVRDLKGVPKTEKHVMEVLGLEKKNQRVIMKNTPSVNEYLVKVKHLVRIVPVTFPYGPPESDSDYEHSYLRDNGQFVVVRDITPSSEKEIQITTEVKDSVWNMDKETLDKHTKSKLANFDLSSEYFKEGPAYKHNEDGKEYRYFGDKKYGGVKRWY